MNYEQAEPQAMLFQIEPPQALESAVERLATASNEERGAIFTKKEVVELILDLVGYTENAALHRMKLLEPSFGAGDFLAPAVERLLNAAEHHSKPLNFETLKNAIRGVEVHRKSFEDTKSLIHELLSSRGIPGREAEQLVSVWLRQGDFLLSSLDGPFNFIVGNPPYVRQELIAPALLAAYRERFRTLYDRADVYIPFFEHSLGMLAEKGKLSFICADRWTKNRYGGPLRELISSKFHLEAYIDMVDTPAFNSDVIAYPAVTVISRTKPGSTKFAYRPEISNSSLTALASSIGGEVHDERVRVIECVVSGDQPWLLESPRLISLVRRLEARFPTLEEAGCKVGIGVATGCDKAYIGKFDELDVEPERKLPLATTKDILTGKVEWKGLGIVNPFTAEGGLASLADFPKFARYLETHRDMIAGRHVAKKAPNNWYRTIDRIYPDLTRQPKLLIPDIKGEANIVFERGELYPHHNLYFITSTDWDLHALQAVLLSGIAKLFVSTYSTKMRGNFLRFQAQYLRRIRVPYWKEVPLTTRKHLIEAAAHHDVSECNEAVAELYEMSSDEKEVFVG